MLSEVWVYTMVYDPKGIVGLLRPIFGLPSTIIERLTLSEMSVLDGNALTMSVTP